MENKAKPIGFFDSGVGGISVLNAAMKLLPHENYIYYGDSKNAPYGSKSIEEIEALSFDIIDFLLEQGVKAIVIACNTATSAAVDKIRERLPGIPVLGIEPALKPAVKAAPSGTIIVMATERTLTEKKFSHLMDAVARERQVVKLACPGLADLIEAGKADAPETLDYLKDKFKDLDLTAVSGIVLGCTHYPFIKGALAKIAPDIPIYDGADGISRHLKEVLADHDLLNDSTADGWVKVYNSSSDERPMELSLELLQR